MGFTSYKTDRIPVGYLLFNSTLETTFETAHLNIPWNKNSSKMLFSKVLPVTALASLAAAQDYIVRFHITSHGRE